MLRIYLTRNGKFVCVNNWQLKSVARFSRIYVQFDTSDWYIAECLAWYFEFRISLGDKELCMQQQCANSGKRQKEVICDITSKF